MKDKLESKIICLWKTVALNDEQKLSEGNKYVTFSVDKYCFECKGKDKECNNYLPTTVYTRIDQDFKKYDY